MGFNNHCESCRRKEGVHPVDGHCDFFRFKPEKPCTHHSFGVQAAAAMRMERGINLNKTLKGQK